MIRFVYTSSLAFGIVDHPCGTHNTLDSCSERFTSWLCTWNARQQFTEFPCTLSLWRCLCCSTYPLIKGLSANFLSAWSSPAPILAISVVWKCTTPWNSCSCLEDMSLTRESNLKEISRLLSICAWHCSRLSDASWIRCCQGERWGEKGRGGRGRETETERGRGRM